MTTANQNVLGKSEGAITSPPATCSASRTERHILLGERWNGNVVKLYESNILLLTQEARKRRMNPRRWKHLIIPQGLTNPRPFDTRTGSGMWRTP